MRRRHFLKSLVGAAILAGEAAQVQAKQARTEPPAFLSVGLKITEAIPTGFRSFDQELGGLWRGDLVVVGARFSMGKTTLAQTIAEHVALNLALPTLVFSLECSAGEYVSKTLAALSGLRQYKLKTGFLDRETFAGIGEALTRVNASPLLIVDDAFYVEELGAQVEAARQKYGQMGLIVVDYLQLLGSDADVVSDSDKIIRTLKQLALNANAPLLVLSQLNRRPEYRKDKRPLLRDFSERAIVRYADLVIGLYRDEVYVPDSPDKGIMEVHVLKNRHGGIRMQQLSFNNQICRWQSLPDKGAQPTAQIREMLSIQYAVKD